MVEARAGLDLLAAQRPAEIDLVEARAGEIAFVHLDGEHFGSFEGRQRKIASGKPDPLQIAENESASLAAVTGELAGLEHGVFQRRIR